MALTPGATSPEVPDCLPGGLRPARRYLCGVQPIEVGRTQLLDDAVEQEEELWIGDEDDHAGWFCVATDPFPCPAAGCSFVANHMTAAHLILVWEERDDPNLLRHAQRAKEVGRNPRVAVYQRSLGPSASYYAWIAAGKPVHGIRAR